MDELEPASVGIREIEASREPGVLDRPADFAAERSGPAQHVVEAGRVDVEGDLVRIFGGSML
jgi:hypothetical protein